MKKFALRFSFVSLVLGLSVYAPARVLAQQAGCQCAAACGGGYCQCNGVADCHCACSPLGTAGCHCE